MNEAELAAAIAAGTATSPTRFGNSTYFALRISGTGIADRPALEEVAYRCPDVWTSPEFLARCNGLPVIIGHPAAGNLDSQEYANRNIGAIMLPYVDGSECWGVARICDDAAAAVMATGTASTSPMITLGPDAVVIKGAQNRLVIEGDPATLDHLAIVPAGVWDKGGPPSGIRIDNATQETTAMEPTEEERKQMEEKKSDAEGGGSGDEALNKILAQLGGVADALAGMGKRLDTIEGEKKKEELRADVAAIRRHEGGSRADALQEEAALASEQARADTVEQAWGRGAPRYMHGETVKQYIVRTLHPHKEYSKQWKDVDLSTLPIEGLRVAAEQIRADSVEASRNPILPAGTMTKRTRQLPSGHMMTEYFGDIHDYQAPFSIPPRFMTFNPRYLGG